MPMKIATLALPSQMWTRSRAAASASRACCRLAYSSRGGITSDVPHHAAKVRICCDDQTATRGRNCSKNPCNGARPLYKRTGQERDPEEGSRLGGGLFSADG